MIINVDTNTVLDLNNPADVTYVTTVGCSQVTSKSLGAIYTIQDALADSLALGRLGNDRETEVVLTQFESFVTYNVPPARKNPSLVIAIEVGGDIVYHAVSHLEYAKDLNIIFLCTGKLISG